MIIISEDQKHAYEICITNPPHSDELCPIVYKYEHSGGKFHYIDQYSLRRSDRLKELKESISDKDWLTIQSEIFKRV